MSSIASPTTTMRRCAMRRSRDSRRSRVRRGSGAGGRGAVIVVHTLEACARRCAALEAQCCAERTLQSVKGESRKHTLSTEPIRDRNLPDEARAAHTTHMSLVVDEVQARIAADAEVRPVGAGAQGDTEGAL